MELALKTWKQFVTEIFPESDPITTLEKLKTEIKELEQELDNPINEQALLEEYADCIICLLTSALQVGYSEKEILEKLYYKISKNMAREWKYNGDGTYSHIKK